MITDQLSKLGKTSSVVGENAVLIALLGIFGKEIPPDKLMVIHGLIMAVKTIYLHWSVPPSHAKKAESDNIMIITAEERSKAAAERIMRTTKAQGGRIKAEQMAEIIQEEMSRTEEQIFDDAMKKLSPNEKRVIEERLKVTNA